MILGVRTILSKEKIYEIKNKINIFETDTKLLDTHFSLTPISTEDYLNQLIFMSFNLLMLKINLSDNNLILHIRETVVEYFDRDPFFY